MWEKVSGIKLHIGMDILELPHAIMVTTANAADGTGAIDDVTNHLSALKKILAYGDRRCR